MNYYCDTEDQDIISHRHLEPYSLDVNTLVNTNSINQSENDDFEKNTDNKINETKKKVFIIPDHISSLECN